MKGRYFDPNGWLPFPELVSHDGEPWEITNSREFPDLPTDGVTNKIERTMLVPLERAGRPVSRHELAHVKWSPQQFPRVRYPLIVLRVVEDARINMGLRAIELPVDLERPEDLRIARSQRRDLAEGRDAALVLRAVASLGTSAEPRLLEILKSRPELLALVTQTRCKLEGDFPLASFRQAMRIGRWLAGQLRTRGLAQVVDVAHLCCVPGPPPGPGRGSSGRGAGEMSIVTAALSQPVPRPKDGRAHGPRASEEGIEIRYPERYVSDQRVFRRRQRRRAGGSVLIDVSGSMSLGAADIDRIIEAAPRATRVALYSGKGTRGELRIVVDRGFRAGSEALTPFGSGNIVDVPALEWLARQPKPRVWISDGHVTGTGDSTSRSVTRRCREICAQASITRVSKPDQAARLLET